MTDRIERMRKYIREKHHHQYRQDSEILDVEATEFTSSLEKSNFADSIRAVRRLQMGPGAGNTGFFFLKNGYLS
jgi:hypothetical protein